MADRNDPLGFDMRYREDLDPSGRSSSGAELVLSAMLHRLTADSLPLIGAPNDQEQYGEDVRKWCGLPITEEQLRARAAGLGTVLERDPRVAQADVTVVAFVTAPGGLVSFELSVEVTLQTGQLIDLVVGVSAVTVDLLSQGR